MSHAKGTTVSQSPDRIEVTRGAKGHTVRVNGSAVWRPNTKHAGDQDILEAREQEQGRVLVVERFELFIVDVWRSIPRLASDHEEDKDLEGRVDEDLANDAGEHLLGDETGSRSLRVNLGVWQSAPH